MYTFHSYSFLRATNIGRQSFYLQVNLHHYFHRFLGLQVYRAKVCARFAGVAPGGLAAAGYRFGVACFVVAGGPVAACWFVVAGCPVVAAVAVAVDYFAVVAFADCCLAWVAFARRIP